jgi:hypothetical protein
VNKPNPVPTDETPVDPKVETPAAAPDPFDLKNLRLDQAFIESGGTRKLLTTVPVHKPKPQSFVRVRSDTNYREALAVLVFKDEDNERYLLPPKIAEQLPGEYVVERHYTAITRQNTVLLWPVRLPGPDGRVNPWHQSAATAAEHAMHHWVRVKANRDLGAYEIIEAPAGIPDPDWPTDVTFQELIRIAYKDRIVTSLDHPAVKRLRGLL